MKAGILWAAAAVALLAGAAAADPRAPPVSQIITPDQGRSYGGGGGRNRVLVDYAPGSPQSFAASMADTPAGYVTPWPMHFHTRYDEFTYILSGVMMIEAPDGTKRPAPAGATNYSPRLHPHRVSVPRAEPVRAISVTTAEQILSFRDAWKYAEDLQRLADYLAADTGTYFLADRARWEAAGAKPLPQGAEITLADQGRRFTVGGAQYRMLADLPLGETRSFAVMQVTFPAGYKGWPAYYSCGFDELWYVLEGSIAVDIGGRQKPVAAGAAVYSPRGAPHRLTVPGGEPVKVLVVVSAGQLPVIEGAGVYEKDPAALRAFLARSRMHLADRPGACGAAG